MPLMPGMPDVLGSGVGVPAALSGHVRHKALMEALSKALIVAVWRRRCAGGGVPASALLEDAHCMH